MNDVLQGFVIGAPSGYALTVLLARYVDELAWHDALRWPWVLWAIPFGIPFHRVEPGQMFTRSDGQRCILVEIGEARNEQGDWMDIPPSERVKLLT
jgi:hypothetical protein